MPVVIVVLLALSFVTAALAQGTETKTYNFEGKDFSFEVQKTQQGKDYGYFVPTSRWPSAADGTTVIYVCWENYSPAFTREHTLVQDAVTGTWQKYSKLQFRGWQPCAEGSAGIRIFVHDAADDGPHTKGLGKDLDGKPRGMVLNFTFNTWSETCKQSPQEIDFCIRAIAVHEFGHAIGFAHEQNRPDAPGECRKLAQGPSEGAVMLTPYDPHSVMNYCNEKYNNDGQLSGLDIKALQSKYGVN